MRRRLADWLGYVRDRGYIEFGPLHVTTRNARDRAERNAFELGTDAARAGLVPDGGSK